MCRLHPTYLILSNFIIFQTDFMRIFIFLYILFCNISIAQINSTKPNIVFILSDDHTNNAIGAYGNTLVKTPNINRIGEQGAIFTNFFVTNSICGPSRAALLTGKYSHINGFTRNDKKFDVHQFIFSRLFRNHGYQTAWIGKWHLETLPDDTFDYWTILPDQGHYYQPDFITQQNDTIIHKGYVTDIITDLSQDWLDQRDQSKPFLLVIGEKAVHREWLPAVQDLGAYDSIVFPLPDNFHDDYNGRFAASHQDMEIGKKLDLEFDFKIDVDYINNFKYNRLNDFERIAYQLYYDKVSRDYHQLVDNGGDVLSWKYQHYLRDYLSTSQSLDRNIGRILDYLDKAGLAENTIVIYGSDQGFYLGEHGWFDKRFMYEESLRTPFFIRYPKMISKKTIIDAHLLNIDWAPTLLQAAGIDVPEEIQGKSFWNLLSGITSHHRDQIYYHYYEYPDAHRVMPHFGIRTSRYKLIRFYGIANYWELYDLKEDPKEMNNLYSVQYSNKLVKNLKRDLEKLIKEYKDIEALNIFKENY